MITRDSVFVAVWLAALVSASCYPGGATDVSDLDLVATAHSAQTDFGTIKTFVLPDTVAHIITDDSIAVSRDHDATILATVVSELEARGFVPTTDPNQQPDVVVFVAATASTRTTYYVDYGWWAYWGWYGWGWAPYYGPGWGMYYPYAPVTGSVTYDVGTLIIDMWDARAPNVPEQKVTSLWVAAMRGVLTGSNVSSEARVQTAIQRAFEQSPYLQSN